jgi:hypothetical protein
MWIAWSLLGPLAPIARAGPLLVGPAGSPPPTSDAVQISIAPGDTANAIAIAVRIADPGAGDLAVLWPMAGIVERSEEEIAPPLFERLELETRPRVAEISCDDLLHSTHWRTVPGCASYDVVIPPTSRGDLAENSVGLDPAPVWDEAALLLDTLAPEELDTWLADYGFALDPAAADALAPHLDAGEPVLAIRPIRPPPAGSWLPPVRVIAAPGDVVLPLVAGEPAASGRQTLFVYAAAPQGVSNPEIANYPSDVVQSECMLRRGQDAAGWLAEARAAFEVEAALPVWVLEHTGPAGLCDPCTAEEPIEPFVLTSLGASGIVDNVRLSRLWLEWDPAQLDQDPVVSFAGVQRFDHALRLYQTAPEVAAMIPFCGDDGPAPGAELCPNLDSRCATGPGPRPGAAVLGGLATALAAAALRRRRWAAVAVAAAVIAGVALSPPALAGERRPIPLDPATELSAGLSLVGTDRIVPEGLDHGAPWLLNPYLGLEVRRSLVGWKRGRTVGLLGQVRGLAGRAAPWGAHGAVGFALVEPVLGFDVRHGRLREASPVLFGRYGGEIVLSTLWPGVSPPRAVVSGGMHAGVGWWVGRGTERTAIELRASLIPRTDGWQTAFDPRVGLPGWMFFPGSANVWVVVGRALYR